MLAYVHPGSPAAIGMLAVCFILVLAFEFSNGFHDTANAVATVIYTKSLKPVVAVIWSGVMNFLGVILGGIAVAYALVQILPADVLSPPNGDPAVAMLVALFVTALLWNVITWAFGIPNSSSHALIGSLAGVSIGYAIRSNKSLSESVDWQQIWKVLESLLLSPILGFVLAAILFRVLKALLHDKQLFEPPKDDEPPVWWMRAILVTTCGGVSLAHGTNDGQKSIGLIMLTIIGLAPATFAINQDLSSDKLHGIVESLSSAQMQIEQNGNEEKDKALLAVRNAQQRLDGIKDLKAVPDDARTSLRNDINQIVAQVKAIAQAQGTKPGDADRKKAEQLQKDLTGVIDYAPWWVRIMSAFCLGFGTMIGYKRIVHTLGERLGKSHLSPAQGGSAELVSAGLIGMAGISGLPVSTTHVVTTGIAGTMVGSGAGVQSGTLWQIAIAWILTLPATLVVACGLFYVLSG